MTDFNEEFGYEEVTMTRNEFAHVTSDLVAEILKDAPRETSDLMIQVLAAFSALLMAELFDHTEEMEVEK